MSSVLSISDAPSGVRRCLLEWLIPEERRHLMIVGWQATADGGARVLWHTPGIVVERGWVKFSRADIAAAAVRK